MLATLVAVDGRRPSRFRFVVPPKVGDRIGFWQRDMPAHAEIVGMRSETAPDGSSLLLVHARSL